MAVPTHHTNAKNGAIAAMAQTLVCSHPACTSKGKAQPLAKFPRGTREAIDKPICTSCRIRLEHQRIEQKAARAAERGALRIECPVSRERAKVAYRHWLWMFDDEEQGTGSAKGEEGVGC